jgi:hypothetical protein
MSRHEDGVTLRQMLEHIEEGRREPGWTDLLPLAHPSDQSDRTDQSDLRAATSDYLPEMIQLETGKWKGLTPSTMGLTPSTIHHRCGEIHSDDVSNHTPARTRRLA